MTILQQDRDMRLYWVTTPDGFEDWFACASSKRRAQEFHEDSEGYGENYASARLVCEISSNLVEKYELNEECWPSHELLYDLGCVLASEYNPRVVNYKGKVFVEGTFTEAMILQDIGKSAGDVIKVQNREKYKIGITSNLKKRMEQFRTGNPFNIKLLYFIKTGHYKSLEIHLHTTYKKNRIRREWFILDD